MKWLWLALLAVVLLAPAAPAGAREEVVIVVSADSLVDDLDSSSIHKLFLGLTVEYRSIRLRPLLNETDARLKDIFLQNIVAMAEGAYDRHALQSSLQQGQTRPPAIRDEATLFTLLAADPRTVTYAWARDVEHDKRLKILRVVWHE